MNIVLLGFDFTGPNKGCVALSYAFIDRFNKLFKDKSVTINVVTYKDSLGDIQVRYPNITFKKIRIVFKKISYYKELKNSMKNADLIFDITYGDSFSDIYGKDWLFKTNLNKHFALKSGTPFIMMPQTYGPFKNEFLKKWSFDLIRKCDNVYSRDKLSIDYLKENGVENVNLSTDLAFALPYEKNKYQLNSQKTKIGINPSSMLWKDCVSNSNKQFELTVDYEKYLYELISYLVENSNYEVHLIPHVTAGKDFAERDEEVGTILRESFPSIILAPVFENPLLAKSYISQMDVFTGARMHATIGSFSSGVPTIPFSYSRKFEGLYGRLDYPYVVSGKEDSTEQALKKTIEWIENRDSLKSCGALGLEKTFDYLDDLDSRILNLC